MHAYYMQTFLYISDIVLIIVLQGEIHLQTNCYKTQNLKTKLSCAE